MPTAFFIDGGFFLKRYHAIEGARTPHQAAQALHRMCRDHLTAEEREHRQLYRIFYYDCPPLMKKVHNPITRKLVDFSKTPLATWRLQFFEELKKLRKVALRLGYLNERSGCWAFRPNVFRDLIAGKTTLDKLAELDVRYDVRQKGVDMRLGLDIAAGIQAPSRSDCVGGGGQRFCASREAGPP